MLAQSTQKDQKSKASETSAKKQVETTNASMKAQDESQQAVQQQKQETVHVGSTKDQVVALLNVCADTASEKDNDIVASILGFFKNLWNSLTSIFKKKPEKNPTKEEALAKLVELFQCTENLSEIANDSDLMGRILTEMPAAERNVVLDALYDEVTDVNILIQMIDVRFGVVVLDGSKEAYAKLDELTLKRINNYIKKDAKAYTPKPWTAKGLTEIYKIYILLPQGDLDLIKALMHTNDSSFGGAAISTYGIYWVNYEIGNEDAVEKYPKWLEGSGKANEHIDSSSDRRHETIKMDMTTAHELGHVVDGMSGWKYSGKGSKMWNVSKWEATPDNPASVVDGMIQSINGPIYGNAITEDQRKIAIEVAKHYLAAHSEGYSKWNDAEAALEASYEAVIKASGQTADDKLLDTLLNKKIDSNLLYHLWRGQSSGYSCYAHDDAMRGMNRPFHQGYANESWFTFDVNAWNDKISCYQFRCPKEEFAEVYASYHAAPAMGKKKGEITPSGLLNWFVSEGLGVAIPEEGGTKTEEAAEKQ